MVFWGEQSAGISAGLYFPKWVLEGDAVLAETLYSYAGRGREAAFFDPYKGVFFIRHYRTHTTNGVTDLTAHHIPNHYALGYMKLSVARYYSGDQALARAFSDITKYPYWPFVYEKTYRKNFGNQSHRPVGAGREVLYRYVENTRRPKTSVLIPAS